MTSYFRQKVKNMEVSDIALTNLAVMFFMMFLFNVWPAFADFVKNSNYLVFMIPWIVFAIKPMIRYFSKN